MKRGLNVMKTLIGLLVLAVLAGCDTMPKQVLPYVMDNGQGGTDLYLYDLESGTSSPLRQTPGVDEYYPCVDPTGSKVVYIAQTRPDDPIHTLYELTVYDLETGDSREYTQFSAPMFSPVWSNNGKSIAYVVEREGKLQIDVRNLTDKSKPKTIGFGSDPSWRVDDKAIFFSSRDTTEATHGELMVHELKTGVNQSFALRGNSFTNLPRGTSVVYTALPYTRRNDAVWLLDANSRQTRLSSPGKTHRDTHPVHINGTTFVAFTRTDVATNKSSIFVVDRYADDPVETQLFKAKANAYTAGSE
jgi:Tol biopolymer transport system component